MTHALETLCGAIGLLIGCVILAKLLSIGAFSVKKQPPAVRVNADLLREMREEIVFTAVKRGHGVRADFQRGNRA